MGDPDALEQAGALSLGREAHISGDGQMWEKCVVLWEVPDSASLWAEVVLSLCVEPHLVAERDPSGPRPLEAGNGSQQ